MQARMSGSDILLLEFFQEQQKTIRTAHAAQIDYSGLLLLYNIRS